MIATIEKLHANAIDETGNRYGNLVVLSLAETENHAVEWNCRCDCGNESIVRGKTLRAGGTKSCGCLRSSHRRRLDEVGNRYGKLTVLSFVGMKHGTTTWTCQCDCGGTKVISGYLLRNGRTTSCGCIRNKHIASLHQLPHSEAAFNYLYSRTKRTALARGYAFELTKKQVRNLSIQNCHYCGSPPTQRSRGCNGDYLYNGIDRKDNDKGYVEGNVVPACKHCNRAKRTMGYETFRAWVYQVHKHFVEEKVQ